MMLASKAPILTLGGPPHVNLMPRVAIERRERATLIRRWGWGLAAALLAVAVVGAGAFYLQAAAQQRLAAENARTTDLITQIATLQPVSEKLSLQTELGEFRVQAMGSEVDWVGVVRAVQAVLPAGVAFHEYSLAPGGLLQGEDPAAEIGVSGSIVLVSTEPADMVPLARAVRQVPGVLEVEGWGQFVEEGRYFHELRVTLDQSFYTGAYAAEVEE